MFLVRDIMFCKPGQARPMVQKFHALSRLLQPLGLGPLRVMTDLSSERYWMVVSEVEVDSLERYAQINQQAMGQKEFQEAMAGYHDLIVEGRREIYTIEKG
jgi:hypothetical protein